MPQTAAERPTKPAPSRVAKELIALNQKLIDALAIGDKSVVERIYADTFVRISVKGELFTRAQLLASLKPPPPGVKTVYESLDIDVFEYGDTAVLTYLSIRHTNNQGEKTDFFYRVADTFVKQRGKWRKAVSIGTPIEGRNAVPK
jgi:ketosteroid isomerase-like protein